MAKEDVPCSTFHFCHTTEERNADDSPLSVITFSYTNISNENKNRKTSWNLCRTRTWIILIIIPMKLIAYHPNKQPFCRPNRRCCRLWISFFREWPLYRFDIAIDCPNRRISHILKQNNCRTCHFHFFVSLFFVAFLMNHINEPQSYQLIYRTTTLLN